MPITRTRGTMTSPVAGSELEELQQHLTRFGANGPEALVPCTISWSSAVYWSVLHLAVTPSIFGPGCRAHSARTRGNSAFLIQNIGGDPQRHLFRILQRDRRHHLTNDV